MLDDIVRIFYEKQKPNLAKQKKWKSHNPDNQKAEKCDRHCSIILMRQGESAFGDEKRVLLKKPRTQMDDLI